MRETATNPPRAPLTALSIAAAGLIVGGLAVVAPGCGSGSSGNAPAPIAQEVTKKSMEATANYYKQRYGGNKGGKRSAVKKNVARGRP